MLLAPHRVPVKQSPDDDRGARCSPPAAAAAVAFSSLATGSRGQYGGRRAVRVVRRRRAERNDLAVLEDLLGRNDDDLPLWRRRRLSTTSRTFAAVVIFAEWRPSSPALLPSICVVPCTYRCTAIAIITVLAHQAVRRLDARRRGKRDDGPERLPPALLRRPTPARCREAARRRAANLADVAIHRVGIDAAPVVLDRQRRHPAAHRVALDLDDDASRVRFDRIPNELLGGAGRRSDDLHPPHGGGGRIVHAPDPSSSGHDRATLWHNWVALFSLFADLTHSMYAMHAQMGGHATQIIHTLKKKNFIFDFRTFIQPLRASAPIVVIANMPPNHSRWTCVGTKRISIRVHDEDDSMQRASSSDGMITVFRLNEEAMRTLPRSS